MDGYRLARGVDGEVEVEAGGERARYARGTAAVGGDGVQAGEHTRGRPERRHPEQGTRRGIERRHVGRRSAHRGGEEVRAVEGETVDRVRDAISVQVRRGKPAEDAAGVRIDLGDRVGSYGREQPPVAPGEPANHPKADGKGRVLDLTFGGVDLVELALAEVLREEPPWGDDGQPVGAVGRSGRVDREWPRNRSPGRGIELEDHVLP